MKKIFTTFFVVAATATFSFGQNTISADAADTWVGYMNIFDLPSAGGGYQFGSAWGLPDMKTTLDVTSNTITLQPNFNTYADNPTDPYWVDQTTMDGNKQMEGLTFVEPGPSFNDVDLTFSGSVLSHDLDTGYTAQFFIKALDSTAGYSDALGGSKVFDLPASGVFSVSATAAEIPSGLIIQYGFVINGPNANPADEDSIGSVIIGAADASVFEPNPLVNVRTYPNPTTDILSVSSLVEIDSYTIFSTTGQVLINGSFGGSIDVSILHAGTYFIEVQSGELKKTLSFVKQ